MEEYNIQKDMPKDRQAESVFYQKREREGCVRRELNGHFQ